MTKIFSDFHAAVTPACRQAGFFVTFLLVEAKESKYWAARPMGIYKKSES